MYELGWFALGWLGVTQRELKHTTSYSTIIEM